MLKFKTAWRFKSPGAISGGLPGEFSTLIGTIAAQGKAQPIYEHFKSYFASAAGTTSNWSSRASWAESDLQSYLSEAEKNAPLLFEAFYEACESLDGDEFAVPDVSYINKILAKHDSGYQIRPPNLVTTKTAISLVQDSQEAASLDQQAHEMIQNSLSRSEKFRAEGSDVAAVQELLWLLETISTAFQGLATETGTVQLQGNYFNKIVQDLRKHSPVRLSIRCSIGSPRCMAIFLHLKVEESGTGGILKSVPLQSHTRHDCLQSHPQLHSILVR